MSDIEIAVGFIRHIEEPCVEPKTGLSIRDFYIREAKRIIPNLTNPYAKELLEDVIKKYEKIKQ